MGVQGGLLVLLVGLIVLLIQCVLAQQVPLSSAVERSALLDLRSSLGLRGKDWPLKADPCLFWIGIQCKNGRVTGINLSGLRRTRVGRLNPQFAVDSLANFTQLAVFNASGFSLPGSIPDWLGHRVNTLQMLDLRSCSVSGSIPASLGNMNRLNFLYLSDNNITGTIPSALGQLTELLVLDLSRNSITGSIPSTFSFLGNLSRLDISSNFLSFQFPPSLSALYNLRFLNLSDNGITGSIPSQLGSLLQLIELNLSKNSLSGSLPVELRGLRNLNKMVIRDNKLEGPLPDGLFSSLGKLQVILLSGNNLDGVLPSEFWFMRKLNFLDLSGNNFTGLLPSFSFHGNASDPVFNLSNNQLYGTLNSSLGKFSLIDLSNNYIQGEVPDDSRNNAATDRNCFHDVPHQRSLKECRLFYEERGLNFDNFGVPEQTQLPVAAADSRSNRWLYILAGMFGGLGFIVILVLLWILLLSKCDKGIAIQRGGANVGPVPEGDSLQLPKDPLNISSLGQSFTRDQMIQATRDFSESNLIKHGHSGDLFLGTLEGGIPVVIKKVNSRSFKKESYVVKLELLSKFSHTRLVPLLGYCLEHDTERLLVYKYMPNGDLANSFYRASSTSEDNSSKSLDWITRLKIAIGAAEGLSFLHHECSPPLVHRDVQASSILLDDKFEVRLGSLSEVCAQEADPPQKVLTRLLRKSRNSEPGPSGSSSATCSYDVYCFGKVLLELVTGKFGNSKGDDASTREWLEQTLPYISIYDKEMVTKIVDPSLILEDDFLEEVWAMAIVARSCLNPKAPKRPLMRYVLKALENPLKVVRQESFSSARLRTTSSSRSWSAALFGSWRHSSSGSATVLGNRESLSVFRQSGRVGSHGSGRIEGSSSHKRSSNEIFPEPMEIQDMKREDE